MSRQILTHVVFASFIIACGATKPVASDPGNADGTTATNTRIRLTVQGATRVTVAPTRSTTLRIAATLSQGGAPVQGLAVRFSLQGAGGGSSLSSAAVNTDDNGIALVVFTAGSTNATTRVVAAAQDASNAQVDVVIDGAADGLVNGRYAFSTQISPLEFMNKNTNAYVYTSNIVNFLVNPAKALLEQWLTLDSATMTTHVNTSIAQCYAAPGTTLSTFAAIACGVTEAAVVPLLKSVMGLDDTGTASQIYNALFSAGSLLQTVDVGGALEIKTYDQTTQAFTASLNFDTYRLIWNGGAACANSQDTCCGHSLLDAAKLNLSSFMRACSAQAASQISTCGDLTGKLVPVAGSKANYTMTLDPSSLSIAYGTLLKGALEGVILPATLSATKFAREANGSVTLNTFFNGLINCSGSSAACPVLTAALNPIVSVALGGLDGLGNSDAFATASITGASLMDTNNDGQADSLTGTLALANSSNASATQTPAINAVFANKLCTGDSTCGAGSVCKFAKDTIDTCFARNQCSTPQGTKQGFADCSNGSECASGTCITAVAQSSFTSVNINHCFQACAQDSDCTGGHCDLHGYLSVENSGATVTGTCIR